MHGHRRSMHGQQRAVCSWAPMHRDCPFCTRKKAACSQCMHSGHVCQQQALVITLAPRAGPTGGAGFALPAVRASLIFPVTAHARVAGRSLS
eukprot:353522-Chlamydomonas_euryale.AAC.6